MKGASRPMTAEDPLFFPEIHGNHGLGPIIPPNRELFSSMCKYQEP